MKKICFLIGNIELVGGTERATSLVSTLLATNDCEVFILSLFGGNKASFPINKKINLDSLFQEKISMRKNFFSCVSRLRKYLSNNKIETLIVVDSISTFFSVPASIGMNINHICWEHFNINSNLGSSFRDLGRKLAIIFCNKIVTLTQTDKNNWQKKFKKRAYKVISIPNPNTFEVNDFFPSIESKTVLALGRLSKEKGFDLLIRAWSLIIDKKGWVLKIIGSGEELEALNQLILELSVKDSVIIIPATTELGKYYKEATFLCLPSRVEGFGMVILEAYTFGLPVIAFDIETGPKELISEHTGSLIEPYNIKLFSQEIYKYMDFSHYELMLKSKKCKSNAENFDGNQIVGSWMRII
ncbi:glycosyltransferase family 4 protein [Acinetobacter baumannii]|uniref:glycosyltransferase family 4 protein n=1 Tax=Acinetobacter baumannii TaxID=470 RepID=UPI00244685ED|nr:glycosyltransferase family 4 protein [Acinetobacter baumannii]MDH2622042.1 glycosyltransferase family 4 protein [Acinetobacter baumannii]